jgi:predicted Fe-Mo cluster-binding NifX family protein
MRIAIPLVDGGNLAEDFSRAGLFALYDIHDDTRAVGYLGRQTVADPGCGRTPGVLRQHGVEVVLGHEFSDNATHCLLEVGIVAIKDAPLLTADELIAHLVSGTLQATPPEVAMHVGDCGGHGCGCCDGHGHEPESAANTEGCCANTPGCCDHSH